MELRFIDLDFWQAAAERRIPIDAPRFSLKDPTGFKVAIEPGLSMHRELTVLGGDWIPVRPDGLATIGLMAHMPGLYPGKSRNILEQDGRFFAQPARTRRIDEDAVLVGGYENYYHWLIGYLPRLLLALKYNEVRERKLLVNANLATVQRQSLDALGVDPSRLILVENDEAVTLRSVLVPTMLCSNSVCHPLARRLLRQEFTATPDSRRRRVYLSRQDAGSVRLANEAQLAQLLAQWGFEHHVAGELDFQEQADLFATAEAVVAYGDSMANIVFCPVGTPVFEVFSPQHKLTWMLILARIGDLPYTGVPADIVELGPDGNPFRGTWTADLAAMEQALLRQFGPPP